jgi:hypothetical protein
MTPWADKSVLLSTASVLTLAPQRFNQLALTPADSESQNNIVRLSCEQISSLARSNYAIYRAIPMHHDIDSRRRLLQPLRQDDQDVDGRCALHTHSLTVLKETYNVAQS